MPQRASVRECHVTPELLCQGSRSGKNCLPKASPPPAPATGMTGRASGLGGRGARRRHTSFHLVETPFRLGVGVYSKTCFCVCTYKYIYIYMYIHIQAYFLLSSRDPLSAAESACGRPQQKMFCVCKYIYIHMYIYMYLFTYTGIPPSV